MSTPAIEHPGDWKITHATRSVLEEIFRGYSRVVLQKEFTEGQSSTHVYLVEPHAADGGAELPAVVKVGPHEVILPEWEAARTYARNRLAGFVEIEGEPTQINGAAGQGIEEGIDKEIDGEIDAGLRYRVAGDGVRITESLRAYSRTATAADLWTLLSQYLFPPLDRIWTQNARREERPVHASYDRVLPVNLLIVPEPVTGTDSSLVRFDATILAEGAVDFAPIPRGTMVEIAGFIVTEIERAHGTVTLNLPETGENPWARSRASSFRVRLQNVPDMTRFRLGQVAAPIVGRVVETRQNALEDRVRSGLKYSVNEHSPTLTLTHGALAGQALPNPLHRWSALLTETVSVKIGTVHGDLNLGNVLVDTQSVTCRIIDCAHIHRDHALYDLVRLEAELVLHTLTHALLKEERKAEHIVQLYRWLDQVTQGDPHAAGTFALPAPLQDETPALIPAFIALSTIRKTARTYLVDPGDWREYYSGLALTLLGSLKFASLDRASAGEQPKAVAFWGAATIVALLDGELREAGGEAETEWRLLEISQGADGAQAESTIQQIDQRKYDQRTYDQRTYDQRSGGIYFEGNQNVSIGGSVVQGETINYNAGPQEPPGPKVITNVWYTPQRYKFHHVRNPALGRLEIEEGLVRFVGTEETVVLERIRSVDHIRMAGDLNNNWVEVGYSTGGSEETVYFSQATRLGIGNLIGGSDEIYQALRRCVRSV